MKERVQGLCFVALWLPFCFCVDRGKSFDCESAIANHLFVQSMRPVPLLCGLHCRLTRNRRTLGLDSKTAKKESKQRLLAEVLIIPCGNNLRQSLGRTRDARNGNCKGTQTF